MPKRNKVLSMPEAVREYIERALIDGNFSGYEQLSQALKKQGYEISKSSLHRFGSAFDERIATLKRSRDMAKALVDASGDEEGAMQESLVRMATERLFQIFTAVGEDGKVVDIDPALISKLTKAIADLTRASVTQKKWAAEVRGKVKAKFDALEGEAAAGADGSSGAGNPKGRIDMATLKRVREDVYGLIG